MLQYKGELISAKEGEQREKEYSPEQGSFLYFFQWKGATFWWAKFSRKYGNSIQTNKNNHFQIHCRSLMIHYIAVLERDKILGVLIHLYGIQSSVNACISSAHTCSHFPYLRRIWAILISNKKSTPQKIKTIPNFYSPLPNWVIWDIYGPCMGLIWENLWAIYGFHMVLIWDTTHHIEPIWKVKK